ncbi:hypothetical protein D9758_005120 [Tetrapyrgos nigripes]|uniref:Zn(2)-C6 fungal-type domain-containing protein n=1 Tax=Tetrapyrgos nigripes TaxID=182062 RepID=A0A8H5LWR6_9AGAR|nr:hypothetical protein D9758_005120 [Tetrapyrgos nigripes]
MRESTLLTFPSSTSHTQMGWETLTRQDAYSSQLFCRGHGCALLNPEPNMIGINSGPASQNSICNEGIRVGDVGLIRPSGDFCSLFNIFKSREHPVNTIYGVPYDFQPLEFRPNLLFSTPHHYHPPNARIYSKHTREVILGAEGTVLAPGMPFGPGIGVEVQFSRSQGAVLLLPAGARRIDYDGLPDMREYATRKAESWYRFLQDQVRMDANNGSLYLITGFDRTNCYENVAFQSSSKASSFSFRFSCPVLADSDLARLSLSYSSLPEHEHWKGASSQGHTLDNLSAVKLMDLTKADPKALMYRGPAPNFPSGSTTSLTPSGSGSSPVPSSASSSFGSTTSRSQNSTFQSSSPEVGELSPATSCTSLEGSDSFSDSLSPRGSSVFDSDSEFDSGVPSFQLCHPSDIVKRCPDALVAITHDKEWTAILEETDSQFPDNLTLISRMLSKFPSKFQQYDKSDIQDTSHYPIYSRQPMNQPRSFSYRDTHFDQYPYAATISSNEGWSPNGKQPSPTISEPQKRKTRREKPKIALAPDQPFTTQGKPQARVYVACLRCRTRKIRCDGAKPVCHNCGRRSNGTNECTYDAVPRRRWSRGTCQA